jgi:protein-S-isoprenylcysteine O-methyltransferase Ste14
MHHAPNGAAPAPAKPAAVGPSQASRKAVLALSMAVATGFLFIAESYWPDGTFAHEAIEWIGIALIIICIVGRTWCALYIGGRKNAVVVNDGPYSVSRNPLYFFSIVGAAGVGAQFGSVTTALFAGFVAWAVFLWMAWREEEAMIAAFKNDYLRYMARVPRFFPNVGLWQSAATVVVDLRMVQTTFFDALIFLSAIPLMESFDYLHDINALPLLFRVP